MSENLTLMVNDKEYELNEEIKERIEHRAKKEFEENEFFSCFWSENERGDPILNIETEGTAVPWDKLQRLTFEMEEVEEESDASDDAQTQDVDSGSGVKSVPKDDVDMGTPESPDDDDEDEKPPNTQTLLTHPNENYIPQPEEEDPEKIPPDPAELPEDPTLAAWIPEDERTEIWSTGTALVPTKLFLEWNVQVRADEVQAGSTELVADEKNGGVKEETLTNNHDMWEQMLNYHGCDVVSKKAVSNEPSQQSEQPDGYPGKEPEESLDGKYGGSNWNV